MISAADLFRRI